MAVVSRDDLGNSHAFKRLSDDAMAILCSQRCYWIDGEIIKTYSGEAWEGSAGPS
jgi:hypothetical protein